MGLDNSSLLMLSNFFKKVMILSPINLQIL